jgi:hypothetical protein
MVMVGQRSYECWRNPPLPVIVGMDQNGATTVMSLRPPVNSTMFCGEYATKLAVAEPPQ